MTQLKLPPVHQLGYVVGNVDKACEFYQATYGVGPFHVVDEVDMEGAMLRGRPISTKIKVAFARSNEIEIEFIQPLEGENLYTEFLEEKGDGIHHLGFVVDDMDEWKREFAAKGFEPIFHRDMGVMEFAYFDTSVFGGLMLELLCWKK
jgi:catechol 2,3-dioxygenase-like lactoylglutathione lyase family enzyme